MATISALNSPTFSFRHHIHSLQSISEEIPAAAEMWDDLLSRWSPTFIALRSRWRRLQRTSWRWMGDDGADCDPFDMTADVRFSTLSPASFSSLSSASPHFSPPPQTAKEIEKKKKKKISSKFRYCLREMNWWYVIIQFSHQRKKRGKKKTRLYILSVYETETATKLPLSTIYIQQVNFRSIFKPIFERCRIGSSMALNSALITVSQRILVRSRILVSRRSFSCIGSSYTLHNISLSAQNTLNMLRSVLRSCKNKMINQ